VQAAKPKGRRKVGRRWPRRPRLRSRPLSRG
jgi:hypothetical protein